MTGDEHIDFREQLERYAESGHVALLVITLLSGDKYFVTQHDELIIGKYVVTLLLRRGGESFFPFEVICNIDVRFR